MDVKNEKIKNPIDIYLKAVLLTVLLLWGFFVVRPFLTLGYLELTVYSAIRVLASLEAINGILLIGWFTAFMFSVPQEVIDKLYGLKIIKWDLWPVFAVQPN